MHHAPPDEVGFGNQSILADSTHGLADEPDAYDPHLDVDFTPIRGEGSPADGFGQPRVSQPRIGSVGWPGVRR